VDGLPTSGRLLGSLRLSHSSFTSLLSQTWGISRRLLAHCSRPRRHRCRAQIHRQW
jgi:hypothetical protein